MDFYKLRNTAFISPDGDNTAFVEKIFADASQLLLKNLSTANLRKPLPEQIVKPEERLISTEGINDKELLRELENIILASMNPNNSGYIGHMDTISSIPSIIGDFVTAAINNNMLSLEMSPFFTQLEYRLTKEIAVLFGLGKQSGGIFLSGGTLANLQAIAVARNKYFDSLNDGLFNLNKKPVILASEIAHTSLQKAAMILGLGKNGVIPIKTDANSNIDLANLEQEILNQKMNNSDPFCIVATAGTTVTGNIDSLEPIARIAQKHNIWLHVDAAYGGAVIFSEEHKSLLNGIDEADSITFNPQKWLYIAKTSAMVLFKNFNILKENFQTIAPYMKEDNEVVNLGEISVQGTRHADILKTYLTFKYFGTNGFAQFINHSFELAGIFHKNIIERNYLELVSEPEINIICFSGNHKIIGEDKIDKWNSGLQEYLLKEHDFFLSLPRYKGSNCLRAVLLNPFTTPDKINDLFDAVDTYYNDFGG